MKQRLLIAFRALLLLLPLAACTRTSESRGTTPESTARTSTSTVQVIEIDFTIASAVTSFAPGTTYHFVVTNDGKTAHEFMIMPRSEESITSGMSMEDMDKMALASISNLDPGETKTLNYTFPSSLAGSHPELACYLPGHYEAGMKQAIAVQD